MLARAARLRMRLLGCIMLSSNECLTICCSKDVNMITKCDLVDGEDGGTRAPTHVSRLYIQLSALR